MSRRYIFAQSIRLLGTNSKTFLKWLAEDGIDASKLRDPADPRRKYITEEQLIAIAKKRQIDLHLPDPERKPESSTARILAAVDQRFAALEQNMAGRFDQLADEIRAVLADLQHGLEQPTRHIDQLSAHLEHLLAELQRASASAPPQERPHPPAPRARNAAPSASASASTPSTPTTTPPRLTRQVRPKRKTKARKNLPGTLTPLATFRQLHNVTEKAVENAVQRGRLTVVRGAWLYQHRSITVALDRQGQQQFYALFNEREGFQECKGCSHAI
jgi:uncharacterized coiled-coil protein SlyX